jgi:deoxyribose-phosphate aldolase
LNEKIRRISLLIKIISKPEMRIKAAGYIKSLEHSLAVDKLLMYPPFFTMPFLGIRVGAYQCTGSSCILVAQPSRGKARKL